MLSARGLSFAYGDHRIVEEWDADFAEGEVVAITAPSGRGKSTLLYLLGLMLRPQGGTVEIDQQSVAVLSDHARAGLRARLYGFVFQDAVLDPSRSVLDNVLESALYRNERRGERLGRAQELMEQFGVELRAKAKPGQVSGGQAQRIALCRALLASPSILLADEPTGNLDPSSAELVVSSFRAHANSGATVIVVTHDPAVVARCDRAIAL